MHTKYAMNRMEIELVDENPDDEPIIIFIPNTDKGDIFEELSLETAREFGAQLIAFAIEGESRM